MPAPEVIVLDDARDPRLDPYRDLRDAAARRAIEAEQGLFVAEGTTVIRRLLESPHPVRSLLLLPAALDALGPDLAGRDVTVLVAERDVLGQVAGFDVHRGALAVASRPVPPDPASLLRTARTVAVLEAVNDHENLGAIGRSAGRARRRRPAPRPDLRRPALPAQHPRLDGRAALPPLGPADAVATTPLRMVRDHGLTVVALTPAAEAEPLEDVLDGDAGADRAAPRGRRTGAVGRRAGDGRSPRSDPADRRS